MDKYGQGVRAKPRPRDGSRLHMWWCARPKATVVRVHAKGVPLLVGKRTLSISQAIVFGGDLETVILLVEHKATPYCESQ